MCNPNTSKTCPACGETFYGLIIISAEEVNCPYCGAVVKTEEAVNG